MSVCVGVCGACERACVVESHEPKAHGGRVSCSWGKVFRGYPCSWTCRTDLALSVHI